MYVYILQEDQGVTLMYHFCKQKKSISLYFQADWNIPETQTDEKWPEDGRIQIQGYSTQYRPGLDLVLKDVSCDILSGQKVGYM